MDPTPRPSGLPGSGLRETFAALRDVSLDALCVLGEGAILDVNDAFLSLFGYERPEELIGRPPEVTVAPSDRDVVLEQIHRAFATDGPTCRFEAHALRKDGGTPRCEARISPFTVNGIRFALGAIRDISERQRAEETVFLLRNALARSTDGITVAAPDGTILFTNDARARMSGYASAAELIGMNARDLHRDASGDPAGKIMSDAACRGHSECEVSGRDAEGRPLTLDIVVTALDDGAGRPVAFLGSARDVTDRKDAERALRMSEEKYRSVIENATDGIYVVRNSRFALVNRRFEEILGYDREEVTAPDFGFVEIVAPESRPQVMARREARQRGEEPPIRHEFTAVRKDGSRVLLSVSSIQLPDPDAIVVQGILRDHTAERRAEEERQELQARAAHAQKMEALGTIAGGVAHDFNNLLEGILGYTSLLKARTGPDHDFFRPLSTIEKSALRGAELTNQLLGFARKGKYRVVPTDLNQVVERVLSLARRTFDPSVRISFRPADRLPPVEGDAGQLEHSLLNLLVNGRDSMPEGGRIRIETGTVELDEAFCGSREALEPGPHVRLTVEDTGVGMAPEVRARAFEPFFTTRSERGGTGLGLAMVYGIVRNHQGEVVLRSRPGRGTTVEIYLPAVPEASAEDSTTFAMPPVLRGGNERILIVDDEPVILEIAKEMLAEMGYRVAVADGGAEAVDRYREGADVVILDMIMPGMSGEETFRKLHAIDPDVRVIISSGFTAEGQAGKILSAGARAFLKKPYTLQELAHAVRRVLDA